MTPMAYHTVLCDLNNDNDMETLIMMSSEDHRLITSNDNEYDLLKLNFK